ncbi:ESX secretion-associated protein EspG [Nocardia sp. NPDC127606]|uniref:ESX secretion-associated protein EspG n=1 Tax=Nocardia sp. NPDC127606 TaxID=3345406 RepID=UPI003641E665
MTTSNWTLDSNQFAWLWRQFPGHDEFDYPDPIRIRQTPTTEDGDRHMKAVLAEGFLRDEDSPLRVAFTALANPETRIRCFGTLSDGQEVHSHGVVSGRIGVVVFQRCSTAEASGPIQISTVRPHAVPVHLAATLPPTEAGGAGRMLGYTPRVRGLEPPTNWNRGSDGRRPVDERIRTLMRKPRSAEGQLIIERGLRAEYPSPTQYLNWIDVVPGQFASGRYLIQVDQDDTFVVPTDLPSLAAELHTRAGFDRVPTR